MSESRRFQGVVRVLDAGCGSGLLMEYLRAALPVLRPEISWEVWGFDVSDHGSVNKDATGDRIRRISIHDPWPFDPESIHVVVSNQVLEHVADPVFFLRQLHGVLKPGGFAAHLFPLKHYVWEGHLHLPFVHRVRNADLRRSYIRLLSRLGLGRFPDHHRALGVDLDGFAQQHSDFIVFFTRYITYREAIELAAGAGLRASFRYTREYYTREMRKIIGRPVAFDYHTERSAVADWLSIMALRYVAGVTWFLEKENTHRHGTEERVSAAQGALTVR